MAESPTPEQDTKGDGLHLPGIERSDSKAEIKGQEEKKKEPQREEKKTSEAPRSQDPEPADDHRYDDKDTGRESQSEIKDQTNNTSGTKENQHKTSTSSRESTENSPSRKGTTDESQNQQPSPDSNTENKNTRKSVKFAENDSPKEEEKQKSNDDDRNEMRLNLKGGEEEKKENDASGGVKSPRQEEEKEGSDSSKEGVKSPRQEEEKKKEGGASKGGVKKSPRQEEERKGNRKGKDHEKDEGKEKEKSGDVTSRSSVSEMSDGRCKQKEFFKMELQRLETGLRRESSKIQEPEKKPYTPFIFNTLEPYYNTRMTRFLIELPDEMKHGHTSRRTAQGLTDPWLDLKMDRDILPKVASKPVSRQVAILKKEKELRERKKRSAMNQSSTSRKEGSTRLPKFPMVQLETKDLASKHLYYSDVPTLRTELKNKYSSSARTKVDEDYKRTHADFYRMELDKLDEVHPINRGHMRSAYFAYLQNTPGSKKAITECVRGLKSGKAQ